MRQCAEGADIQHKFRLPRSEVSGAACWVQKACADVYQEQQVNCVLLSKEVRVQNQHGQVEVANAVTSLIKAVLSRGNG